jgi:hypothetical protein
VTIQGPAAGQWEVSVFGTHEILNGVPYTLSLSFSGGEIMAENVDRLLAEGESFRVVDTRPQFAAVTTPAGQARIRRLQPEQLFVFLSDLFPAAAIDAANITIGSWSQHVAVAKMLQRCLVGTERNLLLMPGERGLQIICGWPRGVLVQLAHEAATLMEF